MNNLNIIQNKSKNERFVKSIVRPLRRNVIGFGESTEKDSSLKVLKYSTKK